MKEGQYRLIFKGPRAERLSVGNPNAPAGNGWFFTAGPTYRSHSSAVRKRDSMSRQFTSSGYKYDIRRVA